MALPSIKPDLVIIDDMGLKQLPKHSGEYLLEVIMHRYENRSTIMTSNRPLPRLRMLLDDNDKSDFDGRVSVAEAAKAAISKLEAKS